MMLIYFPSLNPSLEDLSSDKASENASSSLSIRCGEVKALDFMQKLKIGGYFALWYALNVLYNSECPVKNYLRSSTIDAIR